MDMRNEQNIGLKEEKSESDLKSKNYRRLSSKNDSVFYLKLNRMLKRQLNEKFNLHILPKKPVVSKSRKPISNSHQPNIRLDTVKLKTGGFLSKEEPKSLSNPPKKVNMLQKIQILRSTAVDDPNASISKANSQLPKLQNQNQNQNQNHQGIYKGSTVCRKLRSVSANPKANDSRANKSISRPTDRLRIFRKQDMDLIRKNNYYIDGEEDIRISKLLSEELGKEEIEMDKITQKALKAKGMVF